MSSHLQRGAKPNEIDEFEQAIGEKLPDDIRMSYAIHNGGATCIFALQLWSLQDVLKSWTGWRTSWEQKKDLDDGLDRSQFCRSFPHQRVGHDWYHPGWIPLTYDGGGNHIGVDLRPDENGVRGQVIVFGPEYDWHAVLANSWGQFLTDYVDELERLRTPVPTVPLGVPWSRAKLNLRSLNSEDRDLWNE